MLRRRKTKTQIGNNFPSTEVEPNGRRPVETTRVVVAVPRPKWRWFSFLLSHALALGLVGSWLWPETRRIWDLYDAGTFQLLNSSLAFGDWWAASMAHANTRVWDVVAAVLIGLLLLWNIRFYEKRCTLSGWFSLALLVVSVWLVKSLVCSAIVHDVMGFHRASPTRVVAACNYINELVPAIDAKQDSPHSFPGDHGFVLFCVALYLVYRGSGRQETLAWLLVFVFGLPRMVVGAHWATDIVVGSAVIALLTMAWLMATPLHDRIVNGLCWRMANTFAGLFNRSAVAG